MTDYHRRTFLLGSAAVAATLTGPSLGVLAKEAPFPGFAPAGYALVFADEFDDANVSRINENGTPTTPGAIAWRSRYRQGRFDVINKEKQIYMDPAFAGTAGHALGVQPFSIADSILTITANPADPVRVSPYIHGYKYTSGCMTSEFTFWQTYGYFEMRANLPPGKGFWPAFWLTAKRPVWPPEIDIVESFGNRPTALHVNNLIGKNNAKDKLIQNVTDLTRGFHVYGMEWTKDTVQWTLDGKPLWSTPNAINEDLFMLVNLALGSNDPNWVPDPDSTTPFPGRFQIDYIRVYRHA